jgi:ethanolamine ammonia-lyase large subunit
VLHRFKEERNVLHTIKQRKANRIGHILRSNCFLKHFIEGKREHEKEDVSSYWKNLRGKNILEFERGSTIALSADALEEAMDLSQDSVRDDGGHNTTYVRNIISCTYSVRTQTPFLVSDTNGHPIRGKFYNNVQVLSQGV